MESSNMILTGDRRRSEPHMPAAQVLQIWKSRNKREDRRVRIVELVDEGPAGERYATVVPATSPSGQGRRSNVKLDAQGRLSRYDFVADPATRLRCTSPRTARAAVDFLRQQGLTSEVHAVNDVLVVALQPTSVLQLADDAMANGWAHDADCARIIARLG